jgi:hypothetical protein
MLPLGYLLHSITPRLAHIFVFTWEMVMVLDLPLSIVAYMLAWKYGLVAAIWIFVVGTWWWYFLSRGIEHMIERFRHRKEIVVLKIS